MERQLPVMRLSLIHISSRLPCKNMVIADATGPAGIIAYKAPAMEAIRCTVKGRKAHAGIEPEKGINAVVAASRAISRMHIGRIDQETTSNIGRIEGDVYTRQLMLWSIERSVLGSIPCFFKIYSKTI